MKHYANNCFQTVSASETRESWDLITLILSRTYGITESYLCVSQTWCDWKGRDRIVFQTVQNTRSYFSF